MKSEAIENKSIIYDLYGIFVDYLIDTNRFISLDDLYTYNNFMSWEKWYVAKVEIEGKNYLIVDIDLKHYSYCKYIKLNKRVLKSGLNSKDAVEELKAYSEILGIDILDQMEYYIKGNAVRYDFTQEINKPPRFYGTMELI